MGKSLSQEVSIPCLIPVLMYYRKEPHIFLCDCCICEQKLDKYYIEHPIRNNLQVMCNMEKEIATHSSILAWRIPGTEEPGELLSMGSHSQTRLK